MEQTCTWRTLVQQQAIHTTVQCRFLSSTLQHHYCFYCTSVDVWYLLELTASRLLNELTIHLHVWYAILRQSSTSSAKQNRMDQQRREK